MLDETNVRLGLLVRVSDFAYTSRWWRATAGESPWVHLRRVGSGSVENEFIFVLGNEDVELTWADHTLREAPMHPLALKTLSRPLPLFLEAPLGLGVSVMRVTARKAVENGAEGA